MTHATDIAPRGTFVTAMRDALLYPSPDSTIVVGQIRVGDKAMQANAQNGRYGFLFSVGPAAVSESYLWASVSDFQSPPPPNAIKFGLHLLGQPEHGDGFNKPVGTWPNTLGCQSYIVFGGVVGAWELSQRTGKTVIYRPQSSIPGGGVMPNVSSVIDECRYLIERGGCVTTGINECDSQGGDCGQNVALINQRASFEHEFLNRAKQINPACTVIKGGWSYGTPDFTRQDVCDAIRNGYSDDYNSGAAKINMHLYSPNLAHIDNPADWQWYERRWEFLFTKCGFNPSVRGIWCDEGGLDIQGSGGYRQQADAGNINATWVGDHCAKILACQNQPLIVGGVSHPTPVEVYTVFQYKCGLAPCEPNCQGCWYGYDVSWCLNDVARGFGWQA